LGAHAQHICNNSFGLVPLGESVENTRKNQALAQVRVYGGADANFVLYNDDGRTYNYEKSGGVETHFHWDDQARKLTHDGPTNWTKPDSELIQVVGH
jgi:alpha-D-xyloside xylohydrolase